MNTSEHLPTDAAADLSVVIPSCKDPEALAGALASLAEQRDVRLEVIVVDDAAQDSLGDVVRRHRQTGLNAGLHPAPPAAGPVGCCLRGIELASAPCVAFMEAGARPAGPGASAEALRARAGDPDILHVLTLSQDRWGLSAVDESLAPFAETALAGPEIFSAWLASGCKGAPLWTKIYSRRLCQAALKAREAIGRTRVEDFPLSAWLFLLARTWQPAGLAVYRYAAPAPGPLESSAARALDWLGLFLELPAALGAHGLPEGQCERLRQVLRGRVNLSGARMCEQLMEGSDDGAPRQELLKRLLSVGPEEELFLALAVANGGNALKLRDVAHILSNAW